MARRGWRWAAGAMMTLGALASGCGSGAPHSSAAKTGGGATAAGAATPRPGDGGEFCTVLRDQFNGLAKVFPKNFAAPDQLKAFGAYLQDSNAKLLAAAPADIRAAVEVVARVTNAQADAYKAGLSPPADVAAQARSAEYHDASDKVSAYSRDRCGITPAAAPIPAK